MADYDIGAAFGAIEDELIDSMIRNLKRHQVEEITEGFEWSQWQALQLQALEDYKRKAAAKFGSKFSSINDRIEEMLTNTYNTAETSQERKILKAIQKGIPETATPITGSGAIQGEFFKTNDRKLDALIKATTNDMERAEHAVLRMTDDKYRKIIFNAQVYANTGAGTYEKAVDMATKDFLSAGINCIQYKNGRRVPIDVYAEMAIRTANKRAYLQGEGEMRKKWGIHTVIMNKRSNPCPKCAPFVGKVIVDDVWSGGTAEEAKEKGYLLMSDCIKQGLYHPNCQDSHTTYFGDIEDEEDEEETEEQEQTEEEQIEETPETELEEDEGKEIPPTKEPEYSASENGVDSTVPTSENQITPQEQRINEQLYNAEQRQNYCERQVQRFERMGKYSLDKDNQRIYRARKSEWKEKLAQVKESIQNFKKSVANSAESGIIEPKEYYAGIGDKLSGFKAKLKASVTPEKYKPVSTEYLSSLPKIKNIESMEQALKATNPNGYKNNCQRCVPAYEMRRRGYAVVALSSPENPFDDNIGLYDYQKVFVGTNWITCKGTGKKEITEFLQKCGDGARVEIAIVTDKGSHIFAAEQIGEKTIFIDPQKNLVSVENYFDMNLLDKTKFCRIDNLDFSTLIKDCMKGAR